MEAANSPCGIYNCSECEHLASSACPGCGTGNRQLADACRDVCSVYACVGCRGIGSCAECPEAACALRRSVETICPLRSQFENKRWWAGRMSRALAGRKRPECESDSERISGRIVNRLRWYLTVLDAVAAEGASSISSWQLAERVGVGAALIRKDLSRFGEFGTPSYGYEVDFLRERLRGILRLDRPRGLVWVGACSFRHHAPALARLGENRCRIRGVFDVDGKEIGAQVEGFTVHPTEDMRDLLPGADVSAAVIAVSGPHAQAAAESVISLGAKAILNLSGEMLVVPEHVRVSNIDLAGEILELCYYCES